MEALEREQFTEMMEIEPLSFGMSGGHFQLSEDVKKKVCSAKCRLMMNKMNSAKNDGVRKVGKSPLFIQQPSAAK